MLGGDVSLLRLNVESLQLFFDFLPLQLGKLLPRGRMPPLGCPFIPVHGLRHIQHLFGRRVHLGQGELGFHMSLLCRQGKPFKGFADVPVKAVAAGVQRKPQCCLCFGDPFLGVGEYLVPAVNLFGRHMHGDFLLQWNEEFPALSAVSPIS